MDPKNIFYGTDLSITPLYYNIATSIIVLTDSEQKFKHYFRVSE